MVKAMVLHSSERVSRGTPAYEIGRWTRENVLRMLDGEGYLDPDAVVSPDGGKECRTRDTLTVSRGVATIVSEYDGACMTIVRLEEKG